MRDYVTKDEIRQFKCPECGAESGEMCERTGRDGKVRKSKRNHVERMFEAQHFFGQARQMEQRMDALDNL